MGIAEARRNDEVISLADSQVLRWLDELNGITDAESKAKEIKQEIKRLRKEANTVQNRRAVKQLYAQLDSIQFKPDYMCLIIDKEKDYYRACKGFSINGINYKRLLGTNGGIKNSTIVFVSERHADELRRRIDNGRDLEKKLVPAKLEAYKALTCSASTPVSFPKGIVVVDDCETEFLSDIVYLTDEADGEPVMEERKQVPIRMNASDGYGLMLPSLAEQWSKDLGLDYLVSGVNTRFSFEKGMVFTFDFHDYAEKVAGTYIIKDAWGNEVDIRDVDLMLTTSMVKLWDSYESCDHYIQCCMDNGYTFSVAKTCPKELERERCLNYQFIQSYDLDDDDIERLITPTMNEIKEVLGGDWHKTVLFLKGDSLRADNIERLEDSYLKAILVNPKMVDDPYVRSSIYQLIRNRINEAKVGVLKVHGNYSIVSGDPYLLCQSVFGQEKTGLLKAGEIYNRYWGDYGAEKLACFRAPMTCHANIRAVHPCTSDEAKYWFQYMTTCTIFNGWDTAASALNGMDFDGDLVMLTDNEVLVDKLVELPALMCAQRRATKKVVCEEDFIKSNIESFGNDIGKTTNWITSMFEVQSKFPKSSQEYSDLAYRIKCGQLFQQNAIDKAKGIIAKPMPREWHDRHSVNLIENTDMKRYYRSIVADRKPYFMCYIYPALMKQYSTYKKNTDRNAIREFGLTVDELDAMPHCELTERQLDFLRYYKSRLPAGTNPCVMNKICWRFEEEFDGYIGKFNKVTDFDYSIMKSDAEYTYSQMSSIRKLYEEYNHKLQRYLVYTYYERVDVAESKTTISCMRDEFVRECEAVCQNRSTLCNIVLDLCYKRSASKKFAWDICGADIVNNLLSKNGGTVSVPVCADDGDILYQGRRFKEIKVNMEDNDEYCFE